MKMRRECEVVGGSTDENENYTRTVTVSERNDGSDFQRDGRTGGAKGGRL